jgi:hypothetical protein
MKNDERIARLEHRVRELQTALALVIRRLGIEREAAEVERARLDELRLEGEEEAPAERLIGLYS